MNTAIEQMLKNYRIENIYDQKNAMKEIMQEIVLCGLSRAGFFQKAAFYGGTALRIFYGLDHMQDHHHYLRGCGPAEDGRLFQGGADLRSRFHELHARGSGRPEVYRRSVSGDRFL